MALEWALRCRIFTAKVQTMLLGCRIMFALDGSLYSRMRVIAAVATKESVRKKAAVYSRMRVIAAVASKESVLFNVLIIVSVAKKEDKTNPVSSTSPPCSRYPLVREPLSLYKTIST